VPGQVCLECHAEVETKAAEYKFQHEPMLQRQCVACHSGHGSPHPGFQLKNQPALCLGCHGEVAQYWREGAIHPPAAEDCTNCHSAHGSDNPALTLVAFSQICSQCHDTNTGSFVDAHQGIKPGPASCTSCHDPHGGPKKNLLYPVSHGPFAPDNCTPCHEGRAQ
jgi:predicted CXXCH cytochrome family protein